ncbi:unnamed protein product [Parnassius apollo]|uniref:(apollo) hypothetical protein n=1 Tax=Parnassius apollo TaxID=110799 RepID=A0A8S3XB05_PARAO|nr:unnamed protein product [Parnassius apollo]
MTTDNVITTQPISNLTRISDQPPRYEELISAQPLSDVGENVNTELTNINIDAVQESATGNAEVEERKRQNRRCCDDCCFLNNDNDCSTCGWFLDFCQCLADCTESCVNCADCLHDCCESNTVEHNDGGCCEFNTVEEYNDGGCCDSGGGCGGDSGNNDDCNCFD